MFRKTIVSGCALLLSAGSLHAAPLVPAQYGDFDRYVLALSGKPVFAKVSMIETAKNRWNANSPKRRPTKPTI